MNEIEKIQRYIEKTGFPGISRYDMRFREASALARKVGMAPVETIFLAFKYGQAKGYRAGKKEAAI